MNKSEEKIKEWFEQNYLDGDKMQNGQVLVSFECYEAILSALASQKKSWIKEIEKRASESQGARFNTFVECLAIINNLTAKDESK